MKDTLTLTGKLTADPATGGKRTTAWFEITEHENPQAIGRKIQLVAFASRSEPLKSLLAELTVGEEVKVSGHLNVDTYNGSKTEQLLLTELSVLAEDRLSHHPDILDLQEQVVVAPLDTDVNVYLGKAAASLEIPTTQLLRYMDIYIAPEGAEAWREALESLAGRVTYPLFLERLTAALMLPTSTGMKVQRPSAWLHIVQTFNSYNSQDWAAKLKQLVTKDDEIRANRMTLLLLGAVDPIEHLPVTRQAHRWLCHEALEAGYDISAAYSPYKHDLNRHFSQIVQVYGGTTISNLFNNHKREVKELTNWHSGYFLEHLINKTYTLDQLIRMKTNEIERCNPKLTKAVAKA